MGGRNDFIIILNVTTQEILGKLNKTMTPSLKLSPVAGRVGEGGTAGELSCPKFACVCANLLV